MKKRQTDRPQFFARYNENHKIVGLYNTFTHDEIPEPNVQITKALRDKIALCPSKYSIDPVRLEVVEKPAVVQTDTGQEQPRVSCGVQYKGKYFATDSTSLLYLLQCAAIATARRRDEFKVPSYKNDKKIMARLSSKEVHELLEIILDRSAEELTQTFKDT